MPLYPSSFILLALCPRVAYAPPPDFSPPCQGNPNAQPVQWAAFASGQITYGQWQALNPGFGTRVWSCTDPNRPADCARNATGSPVVLPPNFCGCLGWLNPYQVCQLLGSPH